MKKNKKKKKKKEKKKENKERKKDLKAWKRMVLNLNVIWSQMDEWFHF
jgi:hypothetical protein